VTRQPGVFLSESLEIESEGMTGYLTLNRPERLNALGTDMLYELADAARWFDAQPSVRVVIIRGVGRAFSAGTDLKDHARNHARGSRTRWRAAAQAGSRMVAAIEQMNAITIASVHGQVVGGAVLLMIACDLRVAADDTRFSIPELELGMPLTWGGIPRLVREIGPAMTKELVLTCRTFTPQEGRAMGLINRVTPASELEQHTAELAAQIAAKPGALVAVTKQQVNALTHLLAGSTSYADAELLSTYSVLESLRSRRAYSKRHLKKRQRD